LSSGADIRVLKSTSSSPTHDSKFSSSQALDEEVRAIEISLSAQKVEAEVAATSNRHRQLIDDLSGKLSLKVGAESTHWGLA
jgi:hypothetical protein